MFLIGVYMGPPRFLGIRAQGICFWFPAHFLTVSRLFLIFVLGATAQQTLVLNFKLLGLLSRRRCLLGNKAVSISGYSTVSAISFLFKKKLAWSAFAFLLPSHAYVDNSLLMGHFCL